jgi:orotate phosphoribosyltransferase
MGLFRLGDFTLRSGVKSRWKIECDALTPADWEALALMASEVLPPFGAVVGVPRGGVPFAEALSRHALRRGGCREFVPGCDTLLVAEDVVTTGLSMERFLRSYEGKVDYADWIGVCVFARGPCPDWVTPLFAMPGGGRR